VGSLTVDASSSAPPKGLSAAGQPAIHAAPGASRGAQTLFTVSGKAVDVQVVPITGTAVCGDDQAVTLPGFTIFRCVAESPERR
jgi:hypothetical protein